MAHYKHLHRLRPLKEWVVINKKGLSWAKSWLDVFVAGAAAAVMSKAEMASVAPEDIVLAVLGQS